tara:strand:- start:1172 stop:1870 length:699 start_codon:yes stop_codon:yes gene_type:complete
MDADADFYWPEITIGNSLDAVRFAISNKNYLLFNCFPCINSYDLCGDINPVQVLWSEASYNAYNMGLVPIPSPAQSISISELLSVRTSSGGYFKIKYDKINIFSTEGIKSNLIDYHSQLLYNRVVDWFDVKSGGDIKYEGNLVEPVKHVVSYPSSRIDGKRYFDLFSVSHLTEQQLLDYNFSDTFIKFRIEKQSINNLKLLFWKRDVIRVSKIDLVSSQENICWHVPQIENQ